MTSNTTLFSFKRKKSSADVKEQPIIVITGCDTGIGEALAVRMAEHGWKVFAGVLEEANLSKLSEYHENIKPLVMDVTKQDQVDKAFDEIRGAVGEQEGLTALVNNAGFAHYGPAEFMPMEFVDQQFQVNVFGLIRVTQAAMPLLRKGLPGRIVNIGSIVNDLNIPYTSGYNACKGAVYSFSETLRREVARWGIKVCVIRPGFARSNFKNVLVRNAQTFKDRFPTGTVCFEYYGKDMDKMEEISRELDKAGNPVSTVVDTIYKALTVKNPKPVYYDTTKTSFSMGMAAFTPVAIVDKKHAKFFFAS